MPQNAHTRLNLYLSNFISYCELPSNKITLTALSSWFPLFHLCLKLSKFSIIGHDTLFLLIKGFCKPLENTLSEVIQKHAMQACMHPYYAKAVINAILPASRLIFLKRDSSNVQAQMLNNQTVLTVTACMHVWTHPQWFLLSTAFDPTPNLLHSIFSWPMSTDLQSNYLSFFIFSKVLLLHSPSNWVIFVVASSSWPCKCTTSPSFSAHFRSCCWRSRSCFPFPDICWTMISTRKTIPSLKSPLEHNIVCVCHWPVAAPCANMHLSIWREHQR